MALERFRSGDNQAGYRIAFGNYSGFAQAVTLVDSSGVDALASRGTVIPANAATFRAAGIGYAAYATPTDMLQIVGSATKTVVVTRIFLAPQATAATIADLYFIRRTAANTGGTVAAQTISKMDTGSAAATAVVNLYSVVPAGLGTSSGFIDVARASVGTLTTAAARTGLGVNTLFGTSDSTITLATAPILRGVAESLVVNNNGAAIPAGFSAGWGVEWIEF